MCVRACVRVCINLSAPFPTTSTTATTTTIEMLSSQLGTTRTSVAAVVATASSSQSAKHPGCARTRDARIRSDRSFYPRDLQRVPRQTAGVTRSDANRHEMLAKYEVRRALPRSSFFRVSAIDTVHMVRLYVCVCVSRHRKDKDACRRDDIRDDNDLASIDASADVATTGSGCNFTRTIGRSRRLVARMDVARYRAVVSRLHL